MLAEPLAKINDELQPRSVLIHEPTLEHLRMQFIAQHPDIAEAGLLMEIGVVDVGSAIAG